MSLLSISKSRGMGRPCQCEIRVAALLLLLLVAAAASASPAPARPTVMDTLRAAGMQQAGGPAQVKTAASIQADEYGYDSGYNIEQKEICLMEKARTGCFGGSDEEIVLVQPGYWTSQLSCCDSHEHYGSSHGQQSVGSSLLNPYTSMGSCDWTVTSAPFGVLKPVEVSAGITRTGSASAICYFNADSDQCGEGLLCDRMVMKLEGSTYEVAKAYSHYGRSNTYVDSRTELDCGDVLLPVYERRITGREQGDNQTMSDGIAGQPGAIRAPMKSGRQPAAAARPTSLLAETQDYGGGSYQDNSRPVFEGRAAVIVGIVTAMSGPRKEKWDDGTFEHVLEFYGARQFSLVTPANVFIFRDPEPVPGALDPNVPFVQDKTYKFTFYKRAKYYK